MQSAQPHAQSNTVFGHNIPAAPMPPLVSRTINRNVPFLPPPFNSFPNTNTEHVPVNRPVTSGIVRTNIQIYIANITRIQNFTIQIMMRPCGPSTSPGRRTAAASTGIIPLRSCPPTTSRSACSPRTSGPCRSVPGRSSPPRMGRSTTTTARRACKYLGVCIYIHVCVCVCGPSPHAALAVIGGPCPLST